MAVPSAHGKVASKEFWVLVHTLTTSDASLVIPPGWSPSVVCKWQRDLSAVLGRSVTPHVLVLGG